MNEAWHYLDSRRRMVDSSVKMTHKSRTTVGRKLKGKSSQNKDKHANEGGRLKQNNGRKVSIGDKLTRTMTDI